MLAEETTLLIDERATPRRTVGLSARLRAAALPLAGLVVTYVYFVLTPVGRDFDVLATRGRWSASWRLRQLDEALLSTVSVATLGLAVLAVVLYAGSRGRWRLGLASGIAVAGSIGSTEVLKYALPSHDWWDGRWTWLHLGSFPSGHSVIIASLALAVLAISPARWRRRLAGPLIGGVALATTATITLGWHRPGDVIASLLLATAWHRACTLSPSSAEPEPLRNVWRTAGPVTFACWALAAVAVIGLGLEGLIRGDGRPRFGPWVPWAAGHSPFGSGTSLTSSGVAYAVTLGVLVLGAGLLVLAELRFRAAQRARA